MNITFMACTIALLIINLLLLLENLISIRSIKKQEQELQELLNLISEDNKMIKDYVNIIRRDVSEEYREVKKIEEISDLKKEIVGINKILRNLYISVYELEKSLQSTKQTKPKIINQIFKVIKS